MSQPDREQEIRERISKDYHSTDIAVLRDRIVDALSLLDTTRTALAEAKNAPEYKKWVRERTFWNEQNAEMLHKWQKAERELAEARKEYQTALEAIATGTAHAAQLTEAVKKAQVQLSKPCHFRSHCDACLANRVEVQYLLSRGLDTALGR